MKIDNNVIFLGPCNLQTLIKSLKYRANICGHTVESISWVQKSMGTFMLLHILQ